MTSGQKIKIDVVIKLQPKRLSAVLPAKSLMVELFGALVKPKRLITGARDENRTRTGTKPRGILSPLRLPIPPPRQKNYLLYFKRVLVNSKPLLNCQKPAEIGKL